MLRLPRPPRCRPEPLAALTVFVATCLLASPALPDGTAGRWPGWRGPTGQGTSPQSVPVRIDEDDALWSWEDPGRGHSSPIVWDDAVFVTSAVETERLLVRLDAHDGEEVWRRTVLRAPRERKHTQNSYASSTPATDGERVYVPFLGADHRVDVSAWTFDGEEAWRTSPGEFHSMHGFCSSPEIFDDLLILNLDQDAYAYIVALDRRTGEERWRTHRENEVRSYCPPTVIEVEGEPQLVLSGSETVSSYDPRTGERLWVCDGPTEQCVASVVHGEELVFVTGGYPERHFLAIDPTGRGDVTDSHLRWTAHRGVAYVPSPLHVDGRFYCVSDDGFLSALDGRTGRYAGRRRLPAGYRASLLQAGGRIYALSDRGHVTVIEPGPDLRVLDEGELGAPIYASPAVAHGRLYVRTWEAVQAFGSGPYGDEPTPSHRPEEDDEADEPPGP